MEVIVALAILTALLVCKHFIKAKLYIDDTYNYAFASSCVWTDRVISQLLFDVAAGSNTAVIPPFYPTIYRLIVSGLKISPLAVQSFFDWLAQTVLFLLVWYEHSLIPAFIAVIIFNLSTVVFRDTLYFTDRLWATTMLWINIWSIQHYLIEAETTFFVIGVTSYIMLILSHKHSFQLLLITYFLLSLILLTPVFVPVVLIGELLALLFTRGYSWKVHRAHWSLVRFGFKNGFPHDKGGYGKDQLIYLRRNSATDNSNIYALRFLTGALLRNWDYVIYMIVAAFIIWQSASSFAVLDIYSLFILIVVTTAILTRTVQLFKCIGEGGRYLQYAIFPAVMACWPFYTQVDTLWQSIMLIVMICWGVVALILDIRILRHAALNIQKSLDEDFTELVERIRNSDWDRFIIFPIQKTYAFAWLTGKKILHLLGAGGFWQAKEWFPQVKKPVPTFYKEYDIHYVVLDERYVQASELELGDVHEVYRENSWVVFQTKQATDKAGS